MRLDVRLLAILVVLSSLATSCQSAPTSTSDAVAPTSLPPLTTLNPTTPPLITLNPTTTAVPGVGVVPVGEPATAPDPPSTTEAIPAPVAAPTVVRTGAGVLVDSSFEQLQGMRVGLIAHRASMVDDQHVATLLAQAPQVTLTALFAPEHGLFGLADAGEAVVDTVDPATGVPVFSLYGQHRQPTPSSLADVDVLVYDLQDVGARFFTYTSTLGLAMQAAAEANIPFVVLDRPNPLGGTSMQGPTLSGGLESFIGLYKVPSAYGLTSGELARLIKGQSMLSGLDDLDLHVIPMSHWSRDMRWHATGLDWISPSPNLPSAEAAAVYPGTVLFEATTISEGRGTDEPFQLIGADWLDGEALAATMTDLGLAGVQFVSTTFTPRSMEAAPSPRFEGQTLNGVHIVVTDPDVISGVEVGLHLLNAVLRQAESHGRDVQSIIDRTDVFDRLAGTTSVRSELVAGHDVVDLIESFGPDQRAFLDLVADSLLYPLP